MALSTGAVVGSIKKCLWVPTGVAAAAGNTALPAAGAPKHDYADALHKVGLFYDIQRSGILTSQRLAW